MANETKCLTNGAKYHIYIYPDGVTVEVDHPFRIEMDKEEAKTLETLIHNQLELVLRSYYESR